MKNRKIIRLSVRVENLNHCCLHGIEFTPITTSRITYLTLATHNIKKTLNLSSILVTDPATELCLYRLTDTKNLNCKILKIFIQIHVRLDLSQKLFVMATITSVI